MSVAAMYKKGVRVLVIGGGVIGLTTTHELLNRGYDVTVVASTFPAFSDLKPNLASEVAGAIWVPPERIGKITVEEVDSEGVKTFKKWATVGGKRFLSLAKEPSVTGVSIREYIVMYKEKIKPDDFAKLSALSGLNCSPSLIRGLDDGIVDAYTYTAPMIHATAFLSWLYRECTRKGAHFIQATVRGLLQEQADALKMTFGVQFIVNCSGLGASTLVGDKNVFPLRGALLMARNDGQLFPKVDKVIDTYNRSRFGYDEMGQAIEGHTLVMPRGDKLLGLGSFYQPNHWGNDVSPAAPYVSNMLQECKRVCPGLKDLKVEDCELVVGIRPARKGGVRLETDREKPFVVHNYGHSRWGVTFSWGAAIDAVDLIDKSALNKSSNL